MPCLAFEGVGWVGVVERGQPILVEGELDFGLKDIKACGALSVASNECKRGKRKSIGRCMNDDRKQRVRNTYGA